MLVKVAAPRPDHEGMVADSAHPLAPGHAPPLVAPYCFKCKLPVESFTVDWVSSPYYLPIQWRCCGRTGGTRIPHDEVLLKRRTGGHVWVNKG